MAVERCQGLQVRLIEGLLNVICAAALVPFVQTDLIAPRSLQSNLQIAAVRVSDVEHDLSAGDDGVLSDRDGIGYSSGRIVRDAAPRGRLAPDGLRAGAIFEQPGSKPHHVSRRTDLKDVQIGRRAIHHLLPGEVELAKRVFACPYRSVASP